MCCKRSHSRLEGESKPHRISGIVSPRVSGSIAEDFAFFINNPANLLPARWVYGVEHRKVTIPRWGEVCVFFVAFRTGNLHPFYPFNVLYGNTDRSGIFIDFIAWKWIGDEGWWVVRSGCLPAQPELSVSVRHRDSEDGQVGLVRVHPNCGVAKFVCFS